MPITRLKRKNRKDKAKAARRRTSLTVDILGTAEEGALKQRVKEVSPEGPASPLLQEKRKLPPAPQSSQVAAPLTVETRDAHGPSGPPLHQLAIGAPPPRQNDDSVRLELVQGMVESVDVYLGAVGQFSLDGPEALLGKPVLVIQTPDLSLLTRTKDHHVMLGPKVLHGRVDITGPVCPKKCESKGPTKASMRNSPGHGRSGISVHVAFHIIAS